MNILSFDVGVKNLALCLLHINDEKNINTLDVIDWDIIDLTSCETTSTNTLKCNQHVKIKPCPRPAKYTFQDNYYCGVCCKKNDIYKQYGSYNSAKITKMKKEKIFDLTIKHTSDCNKKMKKSEMLELLIPIIEKNHFNEIVKTNVSEMSLIDIGRNLQKKMDLCLEKWNISIDYVIIENQISPIANRMKTLQGMITQYFIMKSNARIEYVSSENKLKNFGEIDTSSYKDRKKASIHIVENMLTHNTYNIKNHWKLLFKESKKKDDLTDTFLQALWYIENKL